jgi:hypothetical protein
MRETEGGRERLVFVGIHILRQETILVHTHAFESLTVHTVKRS